MFLQRLKGRGAPFAAPCLLRDRHPGLWRSSRPKLRCSSMTAPCASVLALVFLTVTGKLRQVYVGRDLWIQTQVATQGSTWIMSPSLSHERSETAALVTALLHAINLSSQSDRLLS